MRTQEDMMADLWEEMRKGRIVEATVQAFAEHVDGLAVSPADVIYINPKPAIVATLIHELLHRRWPSWSERRVDREAKRLVSNMTHSEVQKWHRAYQKAKRIRKRPVNAEEYETE
jgi:hypothetical protein